MTDLTNYLMPPQEPNMLAYDDTQGMRSRPADPLRWLADYIGQNKDLPAPQFFMDPRALSMRNMLHSALNTSANWLDGTKDPSAVPANSTQQQGGGGVGDFLYRNFVDATVPLSSDENEWAQEIMGSRQLAREDRLRAADDIGKSANEALERFSGYLPHTQIRRGMKSLFEKHGTGGPIEPITPPSNSTQQQDDQGVMSILKKYGLFDQ